MEIEPAVAQQKMPGKRVAITGIILAIALNFLVLLCFAPFHMPYVDKLLYSRYLLWAEVLLLWLYASKIEHTPLLIWKERRPDILFFIGSLVLLIILNYMSAIIAGIPKHIGIHDSRAVLRKINLMLKGHYILIVFTALTAGVTEELIVRGYILSRLSLIIKNEYVPVIISALIFSVFHFTYYSVSEYVFTFLFGIFTAFYYLKFRDIKVLITFHFLYDLVVMIIAQHYLK